MVAPKINAYSNGTQLGGGFIQLVADTLTVGERCTPTPNRTSAEGVARAGRSRSRLRRARHEGEGALTQGAACPQQLRGAGAQRPEAQARRDRAGARPAHARIGRRNDAAFADRSAASFWIASITPCVAAPRNGARFSCTHSMLRRVNAFASWKRGMT